MSLPPRVSLPLNEEDRVTVAYIIMYDANGLYTRIASMFVRRCPTRRASRSAVLTPSELTRKCPTPKLLGLQTLSAPTIFDASQTDPTGRANMIANVWKAWPTAYAASSSALCYARATPLTVSLEGRPPRCPHSRSHLGIVRLCRPWCVHS
ncbi:hypothetical protein BD626DRAFT_225497 [Schizophyllum amplum]|uniref:Uncharacterized protein n=1 Tax=Schizophyllum amplum TaxID=97359 RepID=A0A550BWX6_9AGAR|nr:hypothetical protein BD626DRAFT_225497 [Auriculariopsis ampla]